MLAGHTTHIFGALSLGIRKYLAEGNQLDIIPSVFSFLSSQSLSMIFVLQVPLRCPMLCLSTRL